MDAAFFHYSFFIIFIFSQMSELKAQKMAKLCRQLFGMKQRRRLVEFLGRETVRDFRNSKWRTGCFERMSNSVTEASNYIDGIELLWEKQ